MPTARVVSRKWILISLAVFIGAEVVLGGLVGTVVLRGFVSRPLGLRIELLLMLASYFVGGLTIGLISRSVRLLEPAIAAFIAVALTFLYTAFTPLLFFGFSFGRILVGGGIAFGLALFGADIGERMAARFGNRASQEYANR